MFRIPLGKKEKIIWWLKKVKNSNRETNRESKNKLRLIYYDITML